MAEARAVQIDAVSKAFGSDPVLNDVSLRIQPGELIALLGSSGCGKTTLLRCIAGLERVDNGTVVVGDMAVAGPKTFVAPEKRRIGMVFQDWALFPHLTVGKNVAYGLDRATRRSDRVAEVLAMVDLPGMEDRLPATLSGGQQQRVALARALAPQPSVLLLDEPFSNLDTSLRVEVRTEVHRLLVSLGITAIFVTHDQEEAFVLGDRVAVMHDGRIEQVDTPAALYTRPASRWVASFVGDVNLYSCDADGTSAPSPMGAIPLLDEAHGAVDVLLRPEHLQLSEGDDGEVEIVEYYGHDAMVVVRLADGSRLRARTPPDANHQRGDAVCVTYTGGPTTAYS